MAKANSCGRTAQNTTATGEMEWRRAKAHSTMPMATSIRESSSRTEPTASASTSTQTARDMKDFGRTICRMGPAKRSWKMAQNTMGFSRMERSGATESINGLMNPYISVTGLITI